MRIRKSFVIGIIVTLLLLIGLAVAYFLSQKPQDVRQRASGKPFGKALVFDGSTTVVKSPAAVTLQAPFTIEGWFKAENRPSPATIFSIPGNTNNASCRGSMEAYIVGLNQPGDATLTIANSISGDNLTYTGANKATIKYGSWNYFAFSVDQDGVTQLFLNGHKVDETPQGATCYNSTVYVGGYKLYTDGLGQIDPTSFKDTQNAFKGEMDEIKISNGGHWAGDFPSPTEPFTIDPQTIALFHLDGSLKDEFSNNEATGVGSITYVDSDLPVSTAPPACQATTSTCQWDPADNAVSYNVTVEEIDGNGTIVKTILDNQQVTAPATSTTFISEANKSYRCSVTAVNACGNGVSGTATATCAAPTATPTPLPSSTPTPVPPTNTPTPLPTNTPTPLPTNTPIPPNTPVPPTNTPVPPTATPVPPTATAVQPTPTTPPGVTNTPTPTLPSPGSTIETITIAGGVLLTIIGAILLLAL